MASPESITKRGQRIADQVAEKVSAQAQKAYETASPTSWYGEQTTPAQRIQIAQTILGDLQAHQDLFQRFQTADKMQPDPQTGEPNISRNFVKATQEMVRTLKAAGLPIPEARAPLPAPLPAPPPEPPPEATPPEPAPGPAQQAGPSLSPEAQQ